MPVKASQDSRGLTPLEKRIHTAALASEGNTLTGNELETRFADVPIEEQLLAINGLLKKNLFNAQKGPSGIQYVAVSKGEASILGAMDSNELIIYNHIKEAKNEGIWTKLIKARTNLHQTVMTRCLRLLEQKQLVKSVKSVKFPTRKIYMLYDLTPSIELSGGPWYTDNELDTGFIHELSMACLRFIQAKTWPKDGRSSALYPASQTQNLPTAHSVYRYLKGARLTDTELEPEHVVALLDLLIYDNEVEKIPVLPSQMSSQSADLDGSSSDSEEEDRQRRAKRKSQHDRSHKSIGSSDREHNAGENHTYESDSSESAADMEPSVRRSGKRKKTVTLERQYDSESSEEEDLSRRRSVIQEHDSGDSNVTHVPYVYRAIKPLEEGSTKLISMKFVPSDSYIYDHCDFCHAIDFDGIVYGDPFSTPVDDQKEQHHE
ncbi:34-kDa subunit of RNA polymerase III (C) [Malassezia equina]|uniref:34-kDa subunit of RNA polymerase III (C) n=1 Tax=Malassezia equina TaxID=1381935 RepID=A0AAF0EAL3_9BASI|nr:34-kDa subunit of RNA polymerase III (C) [Malassezia equina]